MPQGARKLLDIALAMLGTPRMLLLDEPTSGVSMEEKYTLMDTVMEKLVALGRALIPGRELILLDEPFEGVAPVLAKRLSSVIADLRGEGLTVLIAESDDTHSANLVDATWRIERGAVSQSRKGDEP